MSRKKHYKIGYGKPPKHTRWKPGQSGNPAGRTSDFTVAYRFLVKWLNKKNPKTLGKISKSALRLIIRTGAGEEPE